jgi:hypothetical protein
MLRVLALAGFVMSGLVGFWQIAAESVSPATPFFLIAMSIAFIFLFAGIVREENFSSHLYQKTGHLTSLTVCVADLLQQALDLKITDKDISVMVRVNKISETASATHTFNEIMIKPISPIGQQAFDEIRSRRLDPMASNRVVATKFDKTL